MRKEEEEDEVKPTKLAPFILFHDPPRSPFSSRRG